MGDIKPLTAIDDYRIKEYPNIIGTMIYIASTACPEIAYAVGKLSRGMHQPNKSHCDMLKDGSLVICETLYLFHSVTLASHRKSLTCSQN